MHSYGILYEPGSKERVARKGFDQAGVFLFSVCFVSVLTASLWWGRDEIFVKGGDGTISGDTV